MNAYAPPPSNPQMQSPFQRPPTLPPHSQQPLKTQLPGGISQPSFTSQQEPPRPTMNGYSQSQPTMNNVAGQMSNMNIRPLTPNQHRPQAAAPLHNQPRAPLMGHQSQAPGMSGIMHSRPLRPPQQQAPPGQVSQVPPNTSNIQPGFSSLSGVQGSRSPPRSGPPSLTGPTSLPSTQAGPGIPPGKSTYPQASSMQPPINQPFASGRPNMTAPPSNAMSRPPNPTMQPQRPMHNYPNVSGHPAPSGTSSYGISGPPNTMLSGPPGALSSGPTRPAVGIPSTGHQTSTSAYHSGFNPNSGVPPPGSVGNHSGVPGPPMTRQPQHMPGPMSSPMGGQQAKRIDPNQMPNPIQVMKDDQESYNEQVFQTSNRGKVPPLVSTKCRIQDDGNCSPRFMRSTVYSVPCNQDMLKESAIPMSVVATPFAKIPQNELQLRYVDHGATGPIRCNRCKAYMNPFMQFIDGGRRFVCNICSHSSEVPQEYFCHLDHQGRRMDMHERPELCLGSYEYIATADYCKDSKLPSPPAFIFMIDVSYQSVQQGMVKILVEELRTLLDELPKDVGLDESLIKVGFVTYSTHLHFYNVKENLAQPQMMIMSDVKDAFVPLLDGFLVNYKEAKGVVESLLEMLPEIFKDTRETDVVLGPVITAGVDALKTAGISGKLYIFHSSLPIAEAPGKLKNREDRKLLYTDKEKTILIPQGNYYMNLAKECVSNGVSIDLFLFPNSYVDVATIGLMVTQTGGQIYRYSYFKESTHGKQFVADLRKNFKREVGFDAIMRLRCSSGLRPVEFFGSFMMNNTTDVELASIDSDKAIAIEIKHDDKIPEDGVAFVQCALLYTSVAGQRRLRIHNLAFTTCSQLSELYRCCELDTTVNYLSKYALRQVLSSNPSSIKEGLIQKCVQILACYRQHCATPSTAGQLILPECLKLLPLYVNSLIKSDVLAGGSEMSSDDRSFLMQACLTMSPAVSAAYFYPRVIALHTLDTDHEDDLIPEQIRCLGEKFEDCGVYLLENTISMFIWVGLQTPMDILQQVFGINGIGQLDIEMTQLPELETPLSKRIREIIEAIQSERQRHLKCGLCSETCYGETIRHKIVRSGEHSGLSPLTNKKVKPKECSIKDHLLLRNHTPSLDDFSVLAHEDKKFHLAIKESLLLI